MTRAKALALLAGIGGLLCVLALREAWVADDALITFRYVDNLAAGHGLVFNLGERVEGYSNPLLVLLLLPGAIAGADPFVVSQAIGVCAALAELAALLWLARRVTGSFVWAAVAGVLFATDRIVTVWTTGGLETSLHGALVTATFAAALAAPGRVLLGTALAFLVAVDRPEGIVFYPAYLITAALIEPAGWRGRALRSLNLFLPAAAALLVGRYLYYGELFANPYFAKVSGVPGLALGAGYAAAFAQRLGFGWPHICAWIVVGAAAAVARLPRHRAAVAAAGAWAATALLAVVLMGGDYMTDFRLLRPILAVFYLGVACLLASVAARRWEAAALAAALLVASHLWRQAHPAPIMADAPAPAEHKRILTVTPARAASFREALFRFARPGDSILADWAGFMSYGHTLRTIDATGLVSADPARDFYLRGEWTEAGVRERLPGHARWPKVAFLLRERVTFVFPKVNRKPPEEPEIHAGAPARTRSYPFLHVSVPLGGGEYLRFFTTLRPEEVAARAEQRGLSGVCWRRPNGPLECRP